MEYEFEFVTHTVPRNAAEFVYRERRLVPRPFAEAEYHLVSLSLDGGYLYSDLSGAFALKFDPGIIKKYSIEPVFYIYQADYHIYRDGIWFGAFDWAEQTEVVSRVPIDIADADEVLIPDFWCSSEENIYGVELARECRLSLKRKIKMKPLIKKLLLTHIEIQIRGLQFASPPRIPEHIVRTITGYNLLVAEYFGYDYDEVMEIAEYIEYDPIFSKFWKRNRHRVSSWRELLKL